jgi:hypothetical protein
MTVAVVLFTSDLRVHDHPPLRAALAAADEVVPLFVRDPGVHAAGFDVPNRSAFLAECLTDLDASLRRRGGRLVVRKGPVVQEVCAVAAECEATEVHMAAGVTGYAHRREERLRDALRGRGVALRVHDTVITAVAPGAVTPAGSDHFGVFTPYFRRWSQERLRNVCPAPLFTGLENPKEDTAAVEAGTVNADVVLAGTDTVAIGPADLPLKEGTSNVVYAWGGAEDKNLALATQTFSGMESTPNAVHAGGNGAAATPNSTEEWPAWAAAAGAVTIAGVLAARQVARRRA